MIPKDIYICYKNLEELKEYSSIWKELNPEYTLHLYDDQMCIDFLEKEYSPLHAEIFKYIPSGPIKADFWRICILYRYGGLYVDADIEPFIPLRDFVDETVDFMSCFSDSRYHDSKLYNPHILMTYDKDEILKKCINIYIKYYCEKKPYEYWEWSIVCIMTATIINISGIIKENLYTYNNKKYQFLQESEIYGSIFYLRFCTYNNIRVLNNNFKKYDMLAHSFKNVGNMKIIPKIIHIYNDNNHNNTEILTIELTTEWKQFYPNWNYKIWHYLEINHMILRNYRIYHRLYHSYNNKSYVIKFFILYEYGGIWINKDFVCNKNYENEFSNDKVTILYDPSNTSNMIISSPTKHVFWEYVFEYVFDHIIVQYISFDVTNIIEIGKAHTRYCIVKNINEC